MISQHLRCMGTPPCFSSFLQRGTTVITSVCLSRQWTSFEMESTFKGKKFFLGSKFLPVELSPVLKGGKKKMAELLPLKGGPHTLKNF